MNKPPRPKHRNTYPCPACEEKKLTLDVRLRPWWDFTQRRRPDCHMSTAWRGELDQNDAFNRGASQRRWPFSLHNKTKDGKPASLAWDCFRLEPNGTASFPDPDKDPFYRDLFKALEAAGAPIAWAGNWKGRFRESVHFELEDG
jgi:hypothetical protein